jgi:tetratricopeptide (TPR) repeat protein
MSRVDRLERESKQVLESASVIGRLFRRRLLGRLTQQEQALERALEELEDRQLIYQERAVPEEEFSFKHVLTQETVYGSILRRRRTVFHQQVAEAMEALYAEGLDEYYEQLAYHYERSDADEKTVEYLLKAGDKARRAYLNEEAMHYFQRALLRLEQAGLGEAHPEWPLAAHRGLGLVYFDGMGKVSDAEAHLRQAIELGRQIGLAPGELVRLYDRLGDVLWQTAQWDEMIRAGEAGMLLVGEATWSVEAALMNDLLAIGHGGKGAGDRSREFLSRNAEFLKELPYVDELAGSYHHQARFCVWYQKNLDRGREWIQLHEQAAQERHDLRGMAVARSSWAHFLFAMGDLHGARAGFQQSRELSARAGDARLSAFETGHLGETLLALGDLQGAAQHLQIAYEALEVMQNWTSLQHGARELGRALLSQGEWAMATESFQRVVEIGRETGLTGQVPGATADLGQVALIQGDRPRAMQLLEEALALNPARLLGRLGALEEAYDDPEGFQGFCRRFREEHPEVADLPPARWFLEPAERFTFPEVALHEAFAASLAPDWTWHDRYGDRAYSVQSGLEIRAANGRDLDFVNLSAPRLTRTLAGAFAIQSICLPASEEKPAIGGLLLWKDRQNYLRLDRGTRGPHEISFQGCLANQDLIIGRGRLPAERVFLRLERLGSRVNALCSADGQHWFTVGHTEFPVEDPVQVGLHAIGSIDRTIYPGAYPDGTAIRFESFELWTGDSRVSERGGPVAIANGSGSLYNGS